ncbi:MAG: tandem-95 repeat protein, partial [Phycisphaera sp.]|nr:tandem-95 repeat protein [Phycisphaera sp.]
MSRGRRGGVVAWRRFVSSFAARLRRRSQRREPNWSRVFGKVFGRDMLLRALRRGYAPTEAPDLAPALVRSFAAKEPQFEALEPRLLMSAVMETGTNDFQISGLTPPDVVSGPATAYNSTNDQYLTVWSDNSTALLQVFGQITDSSGAAVGGPFQISDGTASVSGLVPRVAYNSTNNNYLVVWQGADSIGGDNEIFANIVTAAGVDGADFRISDMGPIGDTNYEALAPDVAYDSTNNRYLVVWYGDDDTGSLVDGEFEIYGQLVTSGGLETGTNDFRISDMGSTDGDTTYGAFYPRAAYNPVADEFIVVWTGDDDSGSLADDEFEIYAQRLTNAGLEIGTNDFRVSDMGATDGDANFDADRPGVAVNTTTGDYLVVWQGDDDTAPLVDNELEIFGQALTSAGAETGTNDFRISDMGPDGDTGFQADFSSVAYNSDTDEFLVVWRGDESGGDDEFEVYAQQLVGATFAETGSNDFVLSDMGPSGSTAFGASHPQAVYGDGEYMITWDGIDSVAVGNEIWGQLLSITNSPPIAVDDAVSVAEDTVGATPIAVLSNDSDPDGDALTITLVSAPAEGTAVINGTNIDYTITTANYNGIDTFTYTISDGNGNTDTATVTVTITSVNDAPVQMDDGPYVTNEDTAIVGAATVLGNDDDSHGGAPGENNTPLIATLVAGPTHASSFTLYADGTFDYTPNPDFNGGDSFTYTARDTQGGVSGVATVTITVTDINDAPVAGDDSFTVAEDGVLNDTVTGNDDDTHAATAVNEGNTPLTNAAVVVDVTNGTLNLNVDGTFDYTPDPDFNGADSFTYTIEDALGGVSNVATVTLTVTAVNDAPVAVDDGTFAGTEDTTLIVSLATILSNDTDVDGDTLSVVALGVPTNGTAIINGGLMQIEYTPDPDFNGADSFTYTISDGNGGFDTATIDVDISAVNDAPVANDDSRTIDEDDPLTTFMVLANDTDVDGGALTITAVSAGVAGATIAISGGGTTIDYTPAANFNGIDTF